MEDGAIVLKRSWVPVIVINGVFIVPGLIAFLLTIGLPAIQAALQVPITLKNCAWALLVNLFMFGALGFLFENTLAQIRTRITDYGIAQQGVRSKKIQWDDVERIRLKFPIFSLKSAHASISVNLLYYGDPSDAIAAIRRLVPQNILSE